jgi:hypothetical protein
MDRRIFLQGASLAAFAAMGKNAQAAPGDLRIF